MKVWEALDLFASLSATSVNRETLSKQWGLTEKRGATFGSLSGGQRQRLFVALALVNRPKLVFLDEMTTGLDPAARRVAWDLIRAVRNNGATVVLVTHFMDEAEELCDRVAIVDRGKVIACDSTSGLIAKHAGEVVVSFTAGEQCDWLAQVDHVSSVSREGRRHEVKGSGTVLAHVASALLSRGIEPDDLRLKQANLEDVFLKLTGKRSEE
jgi:ABC-2 type transport system ATP-binding protein